MKTYSIPFAFEKYGRIEVEAENLDEAYEKAEKELVDLSAIDMDQLSSYLEDSLEIDKDGLVLVDEQICEEETA